MTMTRQRTMKDFTGLSQLKTVEFDGVTYKISHANGFSPDHIHILRARVPRTGVYATGGRDWQDSELTVDFATCAVRVVGVQIGTIRDGVAKVFSSDEVCELL